MVVKTRAQLTEELAEMRRRIDEAEGAQQKGLQMLFGSIADGVAVIDLALKLVDINRAGVELLGYSQKGELIGKDAMDIISDKDRARAAEDMRATLLNGHNSRMEYRFLRKDGVEIQVELAIAVLKDKCGKSEGFVAFIKDITDRKQAEGALRQSEQNFRNSLDNFPFGVRIVTAEGELLYANKAILDIYGYSSIEELKTTPAKKRYTPESYAGHRERVKRRRLGKPVPSQYEVSIVRKDGGVRHLVVYRRQVVWNGETRFQALYEDITERKQMEEALKESEEKYRNLVGSLQEGVWLIDRDANTIFANAPMAQMLGYTLDEMMGEPLFAFMDESNIKVAKRNLERRRRGIKEQHEFGFRRKDGAPIYTILSTSPINDAEGNYVGAIAGVQDITELKLTEQALRESEAKYSSLVNQAMDGIVILQDDVFKFTNQAFAELIGYREDELLGKPFQSLIVAGDRGLVKERYRGRLAGEDVPSAYEIQLVHKNGAVISVELSAGLILYQGRLADLACVRDITERKKAEEALKESEERYRGLFENSIEAVFTADLDGNITSCNRALEELIGYTWEELSEMKPVENIAPESSEFVLERYRKLLSTGEPIRNLVYETIRKDGQRRIVEGYVAAVKKGDRIVGFQGTVRDITERKRAEEALRESQGRYVRLYEGINEAVALYRLPDLKIVHWNKRYEDLHRQILNKDIEDISISDIASVIEADDWEIAMGGMTQILAGESVPDVETLELRMKDLEGKKRVWEIRPSFYKENGQIVGVQTAMSDITERKQAEEALRESEKRYRLLVESANEAIVVAQDGMLKFANSKAGEMTGYSIHDLMNMPFTNLLHPDDRQMVLDRHFRRLGGEELPHMYPFRIIGKEGNTRWVEINAVAITWDGRPATLNCILDITEQKQTEDALRQSEGKYRALFDSTVAGTFVVDAETMKIVLGNQAAAEMFGFSSVEEALGINPLDFFHTDDKDRVLGIIMKDMFEQDLRQANEFRVVTRDGKEVWMRAIGARVEHEGKLAGLVSCMDITERKNVEDQLKASFINLAETVSRALESRDPYTAGHQRRVAELAQLVGEKMGLEGDRVQGLYVGGLLHDIGKISIPASLLTKMGELTEEEWALICSHPKQGYNILKDTTLPWPVADMTLHHHERLDGSGYPHGISGDALSLEVRILAVCDVVEAMGSYRPYRPARTKKEVLAEIKSGRGTKYDAGIVDVVVQIIRNGEFEFAQSGRNWKGATTKVLVP